MRTERPARRSSGARSWGAWPTKRYRGGVSKRTCQYRGGASKHTCQCRGGVRRRCQYRGGARRRCQYRGGARRRFQYRGGARRRWAPATRGPLVRPTLCCRTSSTSSWPRWSLRRPLRFPWRRPGTLEPTAAGQSTVQATCRSSRCHSTAAIMPRRCRRQSSSRDRGGGDDGGG